MSVVLKKRGQQVLHSLINKPGYTLMRVFARFSSLRLLVPYLRGWISGTRVPSETSAQGLNTESTFFPDVDAEAVIAELETNGVAFGLKLPDEIVGAINRYAEHSICYADRDPAAGFHVNERAQAEEAMGKKVLVAQYFNTTSSCSEITRLSQDPVLIRIAQGFLRSTPTFVGANLWWTFPVDASKEDRDRHAHLFHRDVDDFRFFKFFFYLTDVDAGDGAHICVLGSQGRPPVRSLLDRWNIRRYSDEEVCQQFAPEQIVEICGKSGDGFAEDTWCIHKGQTPVKMPRLLLQLQFSLFDYGAMHDRRDDQLLQKLA